MQGAVKAFKVPRLQYIKGAVIGAMTEKGGKILKNELKERVVAWLKPEQINLMNQIIESNDMKNHTEFVAKAVDFYIGYLNSKDSTSFLAENLQTVLKGTMQTTENRMANNLFRLTVEMSMMMYILAEGLEVSEESLRVLRGRCIKQIKSTKGKIQFEDTLQSES